MSNGHFQFFITDSESRESDLNDIVIDTIIRQEIMESLLDNKDEFLKMIDKLIKLSLEFAIR